VYDQWGEEETPDSERRRSWTGGRKEDREEIFDALTGSATKLLTTCWMDVRNLCRARRAALTWCSI
jgi:hypothetical protein